MFGAACGMELLSDASDKAKLLPFLEALDASPKALHRPVCRGWVGDWQISGKTGHVLAGGSAFLLYATTPEIDRIDSDGKRRSPRAIALRGRSRSDQGLSRNPPKAEGNSGDSPASGTRQVSIKSTSGGQFFAREHRGVILALGGG